VVGQVLVPMMVTTVVIPMVATGGGDYGKQLTDGGCQGPSGEAVRRGQAICQKHKNDRCALPLITKPHDAHNQIISGIFAFSVITVAPGKIFAILSHLIKIAK